MTYRQAMGQPLSLPWRPLFVVGWIGLNVALLTLPVTIALLAMPHDWMIYEQVPERVRAGTLYAAEYPTYFFVFPPLTGWLMALVMPLGYSLWSALHLAVLPVLRDWKLVALTVPSVPFWIDTMIGSTVVWVFVAGVVALRGSRGGALIFLALFLLMPRPVHLPLVAWLLWKQPGVRVPVVALLGVLAVTTLLSGHGAEWTRNLLFLGSRGYSDPHNFSPTRLVGSWWLPLGAVLAAWLTRKGHVGLAGLALTPYLLPPYLLVLLWEWPSSPHTPRPH